MTAGNSSWTRTYRESLAAKLAALDRDVDSVRQGEIAGYADPDVRAATQVAGRFLITQGLDFSDVRVFRPRTHHGLLLVRLPEANRLAMTQRIVEVFRAEDVER